jgi:hypothetical protein
LTAAVRSAFWAQALIFSPVTAIKKWKNKTRGQSLLLQQKEERQLTNVSIKNHRGTFFASSLAGAAAAAAAAAGDSS